MMLACTQKHASIQSPILPHWQICDVFSFRHRKTVVACGERKFAAFRVIMLAKCMYDVCMRVSVRELWVSDFSCEWIHVTLCMSFMMCVIAYTQHTLTLTSALTYKRTSVVRCHFSNVFPSISVIAVAFSQIDAGSKNENKINCRINWWMNECWEYMGYKEPCRIWPATSAVDIMTKNYNFRLLTTLWPTSFYLKKQWMRSYWCEHKIK